MGGGVTGSGVIVSWLLLYMYEYSYLSLSLSSPRAGEQCSP